MFTQALLLTLMTSFDATSATTGEIVVGSLVFPTFAETILFSADGDTDITTVLTVIGSIASVIALAWMICAWLKRKKTDDEQTKSDDKGDQNDNTESVVMKDVNNSPAINVKAEGDGNQINITLPGVTETAKEPQIEPTQVGNKGAISITRTTAVSATDFFIGRDDEMADIKNRMKEDGKLVLVSGLGGIGKTETCRTLYAQCLKGEVPGVKSVGWINYDGSLISSLYNQFPAVPVGNRNRDLYYRNVKKYLNDAGQGLLLFVDNINTIDKEEIGYLDSLLCKVILTSRNKIDRILPVTIGVLPKEQCLKIYREHSKDDVSSDELLDEIIKLAACHTLAVELLAKTQRESKKTASELLAILKDKGFTLPEIPTEIVYSGHNKESDDTNAIFIEHLAKVFDIADFTNAVGQSTDADLAEQLRILRLMSLLDNTPIDKDELDVWLNLNDDWNAFNKLRDKGWLIEKKEGSKWFYSMHPVIAEVVKYKKKPDIEIAEPLITALAWKLRMEATDVFTVKLPFMPHALSVAKFFEEITDSNELASLFHNMAWVYWQQGDYAQELKWYDKARIIKLNFCKT